MTKKNYYFDMDGVLVRYGVNDYSGDDPVWLRKGIHYFLNLEPDHTMLRIADMMHRHCEQTNDEMYILTSLSSKNIIFNEHFHDKILWLNKFMPYVNIDHILISVTNKRDTVEYITNHTLTKNDILIDDYNKNLHEWATCHGTSVKYCNGINNPDSFDGLKIYHDKHCDASISTLLTI